MTDEELIIQLALGITDKLHKIDLWSRLRTTTNQKLLRWSIRNKFYLPVIANDHALIQLYIKASLRLAKRYDRLKVKPVLSGVQVMYTWQPAALLITPVHLQNDL